LVIQLLINLKAYVIVGKGEEGPKKMQQNCYKIVYKCELYHF